MTKTPLFFIAAVGLLSGCAGIIAPFVNNKYAGNYSGTFSTSDGKSGPCTIQLTNIGNVFGNLTDSLTGAAGTLNGSVKSSLTFSGAADFPNDDHNLSGTLQSNNGHVSGTLSGSGGYSITIDILSKS